MTPPLDTGTDPRPATDLNATLTSKQREDIMYARLAAKEARIEANHKRYLELMAHMDKGR